MTRLRIVASLGALLGTIALSACGDTLPRSGQARADAETTAACRHRADEIYDRQNRAEIYSPQSSVNTPFSGNYNPGLPDRNLSQLFAHDKLISDCVRNTGTGSERTQPPAGQPPANQPRVSRR